MNEYRQLLALSRRTLSRPSRGLTLIESMVFLVILSIVAAAVGVALQGLTHAPEANDNTLAISTCLIDKMEQLRATTFSSLAVGTSTDTVTIRNINYTRTWKVALQDPTGGSNPVSDFKQITVSINNQSLICWVSALQ